MNNAFFLLAAPSPSPPPVKRAGSQTSNLDDARVGKLLGWVTRRPVLQLQNHLPFAPLKAAEATNEHNKLWTMVVVAAVMWQYQAKVKSGELS